MQPAAEGVAKEPDKKIAEQPTPDAPADQPPAETVAKASLARKLSPTPERTVTSGWAEGEHGQTQSAPSDEDKPAQQAVARAALARLTDLADRQVADAVTLGVQAQREADEPLMPIVIQLVARRVRPPDTAAEKATAEEAADKARAGDVQSDVKPEGGPAP